MAATTRPGWYAYGDPAGSRTPWGDGVSEVVPAALTGGAFRCLDVEVSGERDYPSYVHHHCDEAFYVISGQFRITLGERQLAGLSAGASVYVPRGLRRCVRVTTPAGRLLVISTPGDASDGMFGALARQPSDDPATVARTLAAAGIEVIAHRSRPRTPSTTERGIS